MDTNKLIPLLPELAIFATLIEQGNLSKAAKKLGITPSAVSKQIISLEDALALKLLHRTSKQLVVTESGRIAFDYYKQISNTADHTVSVNNSEKQTPTGLLRIAAPESLANQVLRPLFVEFSKKYPTIKLHLKVTDRLLDPIHDAVDILIHIDEKPIETLANIKIGCTEQVLCASPNYLKTHNIPTHPEQLKNHRCICVGENVTDNRWSFIKETQQTTVHVNGSYLVNHNGMRRNAIEQGLGIGTLPDFVAKKAIEEGTLEVILEDWQLQDHSQGDIYLQFFQSKSMPIKSRVFIDFMKNKIKE